MSDIKEKLDKLDLNKISLAELGAISNASVREALLSLARRPDLAASHQNHGSHGDHSTGSRFLEHPEFVTTPPVDVKTSGSR